MKRELKEHDDYYEIVENGKVVYCRWNDGYSYECTYDENGNELSFKNSNGYSFERTYDENGKLLSFKNSNGDSHEYTYDKNNNILTKIVNGKLTIDNRKTELTMQDIADKFNIDIELTPNFIKSCARLLKPYIDSIPNCECGKK